MTAKQPDFKTIQTYGFSSLLWLAQAIHKIPATDPIQLKVVSNGLYEVTGDEELHREKAIILGPCKVIPQENPTVTCQSIDVSLTQSKANIEQQLFAEITADTPDTAIAYRHNYRWLQIFSPLQAPKQTPVSGLRAGGVYLITGGLGRIGLILAKSLATSHEDR